MDLLLMDKTDLLFDYFGPWKSLEEIGKCPGRVEVTPKHILPLQAGNNVSSKSERQVQVENDLQELITSPHRLLLLPICCPKCFGPLNQPAQY